MTMNTRLKRRAALVFSATILAVALQSQLVRAEASKTIAPSTYGWWTQSNLGGIGAHDPDVPPGGMLVQNLPTGPAAVSGLSFSLPNDATTKELTVPISGNPAITLPPVACPATAAVESAEGGPWDKHPAYDCATPVYGEVNADKTQVVFALGGLSKGRSLSVVLLAGGPTDRIAFSEPGPETLTVKVKPGKTSPSPTDGTKGGTTAPSTGTDSEPSASSGTGVGAAPPVSGGGGAPVGGGSPVVPVPSPLPVASPSLQPETVPAGLGTVAQEENSTRRVLGTTLGLILLLLSILYWTDGFGAINLRSSLAARYQARKTGALVNR
jgi:hypothetical protein